MKKLIIKRCNKCGALIKVINDCNCNNCGIICCDEKMQEIVPNSVDASYEKHIPSYELKEDKIIVKVNHVMDDDHFIEWICFVNDKTEEYVYFKSGEEATAEFKKSKGILYSYCNKHGLWKKEI